MNHPIDVIVPVYRGLQDVIDCLNSVHRSVNQTAYELIVIDDCSPEASVSDYLAACAAQGKFTLLVNEENLGFVATVNRGMALHPERDVLLLNSDTIVANDWLDRITRAAYADDKVGTVTPFSNNATVCSYPQFCQDNVLPNHTPLETLDHLFALANSGQAVDLPTGVGFCMYIRRACLDSIGYFDVETFGKGYGEENDFCQRALKNGWKNRFALDTFVQHTGNVSFGDEHNELKHGALAKLIKHHPHYERDVHRHIADDPARPARVKAWLTSLVAGTLPIVIHVCHNRGGGTLRFVNELSQDIAKQYYSLILMPSKRKPGALVLTAPHTSQNGVAMEESEYSLYVSAQKGTEDLLELLSCLPLAGFHFHHMLGLPHWVMTLPKQCDVPWLVALHDYYFLCESISLTGAQDRFLGYDYPLSENDWTKQFATLINEAQACIAPSEACRAFYQRVFPEANLITVYHEQGRHLLPSQANVKAIDSRKPGETLKIVVIGALSKIKGADLLEDVAVLCAKKGLAVEFELIGYGYRDLLTHPDSTLSVAGRYEENELANMLAQRKELNAVDAIWFTALWPETYSYTLSSAIESGLPIIAPNIGAFEERLYGREHSWVVPWDSSTTVFYDLFSQLCQHGSNAEALAALTSATPPTQQSVKYDKEYGSLLQIKAQHTHPHPLDLSDETELPESVARWLNISVPRTELRLGSTDVYRKKLLKALYYLRSMPLLRRLARCIPLSIQRHIKNKLS